MIAPDHAHLPLHHFVEVVVAEVPATVAFDCVGVGGMCPAEPLPILVSQQAAAACLAAEAGAREAVFDGAPLAAACKVRGHHLIGTTRSPSSASLEDGGP